MAINRGKIILYKNKIQVRLKNDTIWLNLNQIAELFQRDKSVISRHVNNIFKTKELNKNSVVAKFATTAADGNKRIACLLFLIYLAKNNYLFNTKGEKKFNDNALVALALLIAESNPKDKDVLIKLIINFLN